MKWAYPMGNYLLQPGLYGKTKRWWASWKKDFAFSTVAWMPFFLAFPILVEMGIQLYKGTDFSGESRIWGKYIDWLERMGARRLFDGE